MYSSRKAKSRKPSKVQKWFKSKGEALKKHKLGALKQFKVPETPDEEYMDHSAVFLAIEASTISLRESCLAFQQRLSAFFKAFEDLGETFAATALCNGDEQNDRAYMTQCIFEMQNQTKAKVLDVVTDYVVHPLDKKLAQMADVKTEMERRRQAKIEYDYYCEKMRKLRQKETVSEKTQEKIDRNEPKLEEAKAELTKLSRPLIALFLKYESIRSDIVAAEFETFKKCQQTFFSCGNETFNKIETNETELLELPSLAEFSAAGSISAAFSEPPTTDILPNELDDGDDNDNDGDVFQNDYNEQEEEQTVVPPMPTQPAPVPGLIESDPENNNDVLDTTNEREVDDSIGEGVPAIALFDFEPSAEDEVRLVAGVELTVLVQNEGGWWEGDVDGEIGLFPSNYVKLL